MEGLVDLDDHSLEESAEEVAANALMEWSQGQRP
jgi:hypothetical protein